MQKLHSPGEVLPLTLMPYGYVPLPLGLGSDANTSKPIWASNPVWVCVAD